MYYNLYTSRQDAENEVKKIIKELKRDWSILYHKEINNIPHNIIILEDNIKNNRVKGLAYYHGKENTVPNGNYRGFLIKIAGPLIRNRRQQNYEIIYRLAWNNSLKKIN